MTIRVGINGYGRIGRNVLRALYEEHHAHDLAIVAINNRANSETNLHLTKYDTTFGRFKAQVMTQGNDLIVDGDRIRMFCAHDPADIPWHEAQVDVVLECTGKFTSRESTQVHLENGAKKVIISAPGKGVDATVVYGVNHHLLRAEHQIISNASCTTNCLAPIVKPLHDALGIVSGFMSTVHAVTNDQVLIDRSHKDLRRARSATQSIIPTKTGAAAAVGLVLPELAGKLDGVAMRVPTINVSAVDLTFKASRATTVEEVDQLLRDAAQGELAGVLAVNDEPLVSCDFNHHPASAIYDATQTRVMGDLVKVVAWYDNEWGFSNRMLDVAVALMQAK
ncbi:MAG: type I glyceraldehyde-3-phosphate dehydrogenase [Legionellales bacterium]|nr:type I glyceraldehyde-3-phosphate dehydrogenase [Legionellales bacterium]